MMHLKSQDDVPPGLDPPNHQCKRATLAFSTWKEEEDDGDCIKAYFSMAQADDGCMLQGKRGRGAW